MELHSYAKTRSSRKWTIDQKRKLVENRITLDVLFNKKSFNLVDSWIKLIKVSDFESFDTQFVRNQWINILSKYKNLVELHTKDMSVDINEETRDLLTSQWEFFDKIYRWIKYKEKMNHNCDNIISEEIDDESINLQLELISTTESSTEDDTIIKSNNNTTTTNIVQQPNEQKLKINSSSPNILFINSQNNNYPNLSFQQQQEQKNLISKNTTSNNNFPNNINLCCSSKSNNKNSIIKSTRINNNRQQKQSINPNLTSQQNLNINSNNNYQNNMNTIYNMSKQPKQNINETTAEQINISGTVVGDLIDDHTNSKKLHKRRSNKLKKKYKNHWKYFNYKRSSRKIERKFNTFCQIFAQIVEKDYPDINVTNLLYSSDDSTSSSD